MHVKNDEHDNVENEYNEHVKNDEHVNVEIEYNEHVKNDVHVNVEINDKQSMIQNPRSIDSIVQRAGCNDLSSNAPVVFVFIVSYHAR